MLVPTLPALVRVLDNLPSFVCSYAGPGPHKNLHPLQLSIAAQQSLIPSTRRKLEAEVNSDSIAASLVVVYADYFSFSIAAC